MGAKRASSAGASGASACKRRPPTVLERAEKALYDSCKGMTREQKYVKRVGNKNLLELVCDELEKLDAQGGNKKIGANRWKELKAPYIKADVTSAADALEVAVSQAEVVDPTLMKGVIAARRAHPDRSVLLNYLPSAGKLNRTGICGLWKLALSLNPRCRKQMPLCQAIVKHMHAAELPSTYEREYAAVYQWVVDVLCAAFHKSGLEPMQFTKLWGNVLKLVLPGESLDRAGAVQYKYEQAQDAMEDLVVSCNLGMELFSGQIAKTVETRVQEIIDGDLAKLFDGAAVDADKLTAKKLELEKRVEAMPAASMLPPRRTVKIWYRGQGYFFKVKSISEQVNIAVACAWKGRAVMEGKLLPTWAEEMLIGGYKGEQVASKLKAGLVDACVLAREKGDKAYKANEGLSGPAMLAALRPSLQQCEAIDVDFQVESMLIDNVCGESSTLLLADRCMELLPSADKHVPVESALQAVSQLSHGSLYKLAPKAAQAKIDLVVKWIGLLLEFREPEYGEAGDCRTMLAIKARFQYFIEFSKAGSSGGKKAVVGSAALADIYSQAQQNMEKGSCTMADCWQLQAFRSLLPEGLRDPAAVLLKTVQKKNLKATAKSKPASSKDSAVAQAMALFLSSS